MHSQNPSENQTRIQAGKCGRLMKEIGAKWSIAYFILFYFLTEIPDFFFGEANEASLHEQHTP